MHETSPLDSSYKLKNETDKCIKTHRKWLKLRNSVVDFSDVLTSFPATYLGPEATRPGKLITIAHDQTTERYDTLSLYGTPDDVLYSVSFILLEGIASSLERQLHAAFDVKDSEKAEITNIWWIDEELGYPFFYVVTGPRTGTPHFSEVPIIP